MNYFTQNMNNYPQEKKSSYNLLVRAEPEPNFTERKVCANNM